MLRLEEIRNKIIEMGLQIGLDGNSPLYPAFSELDKVFNEGASIYVTSSQYHYIIFERGNVIKHYKSREIENITPELEHRKSGYVERKRSPYQGNVVRIA